MTKIGQFFGTFANFTAFFYKNVRFFLICYCFMHEKEPHETMQPKFFLLFPVLYSAGACVPVAGNVGTFSASVD